MTNLKVLAMGDDDVVVIIKRKQIAEAVPGRVYRVVLGLVVPNSEQPRKIFDQESLKETADSLRDDVEEPIRVVVRSGQSGLFFMIVDGERRWRSAKMAGLETISCLVRQSMSDNLIYLSSAKANIGRESFNPIDEAGVVVELKKRFGWDQAQIAKELGKSQGHISNVIKYLKLCDSLQKRLIKDEMDKAVALNLASFPPEKQEALHERYVEEVGDKKLNPRDIPRRMKGIARKMEIIPRPSKKGKKHATHPDLVISNLIRAISGFRGAMKEVGELSDEDIMNQRACHIIDLINVVKNCHDDIGELAERIDVLD